MKIAILVDGGFYRQRAKKLWGDKSAQERAAELIQYCHKHISHSAKKIYDHEEYLYRIFYYDCPPCANKIYHPLLKKQIDFGKSALYEWMNIFLEELKKQRKVALRMGRLSESQVHYSIRYEKVKALCNKTITIDDLTEADFEISLEQKGVDMKIGTDIASLAYKKQVDQIILISGDSDFVPAAKLARREGIDFVLDPLWATIKADLHEHIDGLYSCAKSTKASESTNNAT